MTGSIWFQGKVEQRERYTNTRSVTTWCGKNLQGILGDVPATSRPAWPRLAPPGDVVARRRPCPALQFGASTTR